MDYPKVITPEWLRQHRECIFVYGDNDLHIGLGGAALCRNEPNTYGFSTKKEPNSKDSSYYRPETYSEKLAHEIDLLHIAVSSNPNKTFLISKLGAGMANRFNIRPMIVDALREFEIYYNNVVFLGD